MSKNSEKKLNCLYNVIDFILWKEWEPIGGGQIGIPRDEYSSYTAKILSAKLAKLTAHEIAKILYSFTVKEMGMTGNFDHDLKIAERIYLLDENESSFPTEIDHYISEQEINLNGIFDKFGYPINYFFYEMNNMENEFKSIRKHKIQILDSFRNRWQEIIDSGYSWINFAPVGYWEQAFVFCIEFNNNKFQVPTGKTHILCPGLPIKYTGETVIQFEENVKVVE